MEVIKTGDPTSFNDAHLLEQQGELKKARSLYERLLKQSAHKSKILHRLMIVARKQKDTEAEVRYINTAIDILQQQYPQADGKDKKLATLSTKLNRLLGHVDKKGRAMLLPPEILKLEQRKQRLLKKPSSKKK